ncbi:rhodopsin kinase GRK7-like [Petromyzon marinus]|uniref:G protein-coupled receptor kinase n=1 Tax=Petromyzon marinus TaxID=7757 RepID=A0AAJ7UFA6_PETMA|nr:rhodopsin kinase GRK7-like [Petromyzon marinus]
MCDMDCLDNLIANTAYLEARKSGDGGTRDKARRSIVLPTLTQGRSLRKTIPDSSVDYGSVCEAQPIGRHFFREFLDSQPQYSSVAAFADAATKFELAEDDGGGGGVGGGRGAMLDEALAFLRRDSGERPAFVSESLAATAGSSDAAEREAAIALAKREMRTFLSGAPFRGFLGSAFYEKFLQWKVLERKPMTDKNFYEFRMLGKGGFGEVCAMQAKMSGKMYACKKLDKKRLKKKNGEKMALLEKELLEMVNSAFVVQLAYAYETKTHLCLTMSLMNGGDLKYHIYEMGELGLEMERVLFYAAQITCGMQHLHALRIIYRDMKPENVLLDEAGHCRLSDLGLAVLLKDDGMKITERAGTNGYMAPEVINGEGYTYSCDWFSLGCTIYEMIAGRTPFKGHKEKVTKDEVRRRTLEDNVAYLHRNFCPNSKNICDQLLAKKPANRLGCRGDDDNPRKHPYFQSINFFRLEAGLVNPPFVPDPGKVYAKDISDIMEFSEAKGIEINEKDQMFYSKFSTGCIPATWQEEMIETGLFEELNDPNRVVDVEKGRMSNGNRSSTCILL